MKRHPGACGGAAVTGPGPERPGDCHLCWLARNDPAYAGLWEGYAGEFAPAVRHEPCQFLGEVLVREGCARCWLRKCPVKGVCTTGQLRPGGTACCQTCEDYQP